MTDMTQPPPPPPRGTYASPPEFRFYFLSPGEQQFVAIATTLDEAQAKVREAMQFPDLALALITMEEVR